MVFKTDTLALSDLLSGPTTFQIPTFQRAFSWTELEASQLFDDLYQAHSRADHMSGRSLANGNYFLGSIIVGRDGETGPFNIVDGQQRLITLTAILAVLRDALPAGQQQDDLQFHIERPTNTLLYERSPRILLHPRWRQKFEEWIIKPNGTKYLPDQHEDEVLDKLLCVIKKIREDLCVPFIPKSAHIISLSRFLLTKTCVLMLTAKNMDDAYLLFRSVNTPGRPLSTLDLVRGELLGQTMLGSAESHVLADAWQEIEAEVGPEKFEGYINTIVDLVISFDDEYTLKSKIKSVFQDANRLQNFRDRLRRFVKAYVDLSNASLDFGKESNGRINRLVACLRNLPFDEWQSVALLWLSANPSPTKTYDFFSYLNALCLGLCILGTKEPKRIKRFQNLVALLRANKDIFALNSDLFLSEDEKATVRSKLRKGIKDSKLIKHLMLRMNAEMQTTEIPIYFPENITIEHVLPQKPSPDSKWIELFGDATRRKQLCMSLGNLTILTGPANAEIGNSDFEKKKNLVFGANGNQAFAMNMEIASKNSWNEQAILARHDKLLSIADKVLRL